MLPITFNQLFAKSLFNIPLPANDLGGYCRECGGPIEEGKGRMIVKTKKGEDEGGKLYPDTWVDEGIIPYNASTVVCEPCFQIGKGSTTRSATLPSMGQVLLVTPDKTYPAADKLNKVWPDENDKENTGRSVKKDTIYSDALTVIDFLRMLPEIPTPFGVIIGNGGMNDKHFFRSVPLNWNIGESILGLVMSDYRFVSFRWKILKVACEDGISQEVAKLPKGKRGDAFIDISQSHNLTGTESKLFTYTMLGLS